MLIVLFSKIAAVTISAKDFNPNVSVAFSGLSIKCWECRSDSDPKCADPFDNSTLSITDCKQNAELEHLPGVKATMCRKIRQKGSSVVHSLVMVCLATNACFSYNFQ